MLHYGHYFKTNPQSVLITRLLSILAKESSRYVALRRAFQPVRPIIDLSGILVFDSFAGSAS
jgi:hypothetical protein